MPVFQTKQIIVGLTPVRVDLPPLNSRKRVCLSVNLNGQAWIKFGHCTSQCGYPLRGMQVHDMDCPDYQQIWAIGSTNGLILYVCEVG